MTPTNEAFEALRHEFERWARSENWLIPRNSFGEYVYATTRDGWAAYQAATERAAKMCEERATAYRTTRAPGWHEVDHECAQCAAAIRGAGGAKA